MIIIITMSVAYIFRTKDSELNPIFQTNVTLNLHLYFHNVSTFGVTAGTNCVYSFLACPLTVATGPSSCC